MWSEWFQGAIDEVRVYNRALPGTEILADMNRPVTNPDTTAPTAPGTLTATGNVSSAQLRWGACDGSRRRRALQRPPLDVPRLHAGRRQQDCAADRRLVHQHRSLPARTTTR